MHRFTANFTGGHDDTSGVARRDARRPARELRSPTARCACSAEDGDISLHCRITAAGDAAAKHTLVVAVTWSHAQFRDFAFAAE